MNSQSVDTVRRVLAQAALAIVEVCVFALPSLAMGQSPAPAATVGFRSPTETPVVLSEFAARAPMLATATAGKRLIAVGMRGRISWSDDGGKVWSQAKVPVQVDLVAVSFSTEQDGWAVGHRGVVLESHDAGVTWVRRFADQQLNELAVRHYQTMAPKPGEAAALAMSQAARAITEGSIPSILDVWFESPRAGTMVGTFNTIFRTADGGKTWTPAMDLTDNPDELHFYAVRGGDGGLFLAGEKGNVWRLDSSSDRWVMVPTGYAGTLFGLVVDGPRVLAYGMRGSAFVSNDSGRHWQAALVGNKAGIVAGLRLKSGEVLLVNQTGDLLRSERTWLNFSSVNDKSRVFAFSLAQLANGQVVAAGLGGINPVAFP